MKYAGSFLAALLAIVVSTKEARAEDDWFGTDKALHFGVSVALSGGGYAASALVFDRRWERATTGAAFSLTLGAAKELYDLAGHGGGHRDCAPRGRRRFWKQSGGTVGPSGGLGGSVLKS